MKHTNLLLPFPYHQEREKVVRCVSFIVFYAPSIISSHIISVRSFVHPSVYPMLARNAIHHNHIPPIHPTPSSLTSISKPNFPPLAQAPNATSRPPQAHTAPPSYHPPCISSAFVFPYPYPLSIPLSPSCNANSHLFPTKNQSLLNRWNAFFFFDFLFDLGDLGASVSDRTQ